MNETTIFIALVYHLIAIEEKMQTANELIVSITCLQYYTLLNWRPCEIASMGRPGEMEQDRAEGGVEPQWRMLIQAKEPCGKEKGIVSGVYRDTHVYMYDVSVYKIKQFQRDGKIYAYYLLIQ